LKFEIIGRVRAIEVIDRGTSLRDRRPLARLYGLEVNGAICVRNDDYPASLELRKLYPVLSDDFAAQHDIST
jgi:hypothetical protein